MNFNVSIWTKDNFPIVEIKDFYFEEGKINFLFGESGIGKSLISKAIYGILNPFDLNIYINNKSYFQYLNTAYVSEIRKNGFFVFQETSTHLNPTLKISEQLEEGDLSEFSSQFLDDFKYLFYGKKEEFISFLSHSYPKPHRPSGGEKQRILASMAIKKMQLLIEKNSYSNLNLFVFDEPSGNLDDKYRDLLFDLIVKKYLKGNFTILFITHDYSLIGKIYSQYENLLTRAKFLELRKEESGLSLVEFNSRNYLDWLKSFPEGYLNQNKTDFELLKIYPDLQIFGRKLSIVKDKEKFEKKDLTINKGQIVYLKAESGMGKTSLAKAICGLIKPDKIKARIWGTTIDENTKFEFYRDRLWGKKIAMCFQHSDEALNLNDLTYQAFEPFIKNKTYLEKTDLIEKNLFKAFDYETTKIIFKRKIKHLSGGQKQKINLLRSFLSPAEIIILDEPISGMDFESVKKTFDIIKNELQNRGILLISHNEEIFSKAVGSENIFYLVENEQD